MYDPKHQTNTWEDTIKMATANNEFFASLADLEKERGLPADYLIEKIKAAIVIAVKKDYEVEDDNVAVDIDPVTASFRVTLLRDIVELSEFYVARGDAHRLRDLDSDFHEAVYPAGGSRMLSSTLSALHRKIGAYRALSLTDPGRVPDSVREHREIFDAIERKDASAADCLAARHVESALNNLLRLLPPRKTS